LNLSLLDQERINNFVKFPNLKFEYKIKESKSLKQNDFNNQYYPIGLHNIKNISYMDLSFQCLYHLLPLLNKIKSKQSFFRKNSVSGTFYPFIETRFQGIIPNTQETKKSISQSSGCFKVFNQENKFYLL
jgi:ubiquitin C-terminal hydrolase